jgi:hypothetical protein
MFELRHRIPPRYQGCEGQPASLLLTSTPSLVRMRGKVAEPNCFVGGDASLWQPLVHATMLIYSTAV